jgi:hypothetical protein
MVDGGMRMKERWSSHEEAGARIKDKLGDEWGEEGGRGARDKGAGASGRERQAGKRAGGGRTAPAWWASACPACPAITPPRHSPPTHTPHHTPFAKPSRVEPGPAGALGESRRLATGLILGKGRAASPLHSPFLPYTCLPAAALHPYIGPPSHLAAVSLDQPSRRKPPLVQPSRACPPQPSGPGRTCMACWGMPCDPKPAPPMPPSATRQWIQHSATGI